MDAILHYMKANCFYIREFYDFSFFIGSKVTVAVHLWHNNTSLISIIKLSDLNIFQDKSWHSLN